MAPLKLSHLATEGAEQDLEEVLLEDTPIGPPPRRAEGRDTAFAERPTPRRTWLSRLRGLRWGASGREEAVVVFEGAVAD